MIPYAVNFIPVLYSEYIPIEDWYQPPPDPSRRARTELERKDMGQWAYPKPIDVRQIPEDRLNTRRSTPILRFKGSRSLRRCVRQA